MLPFFCLPNFFCFSCFQRTFFIYLLFYLSLTLSRVGELKTSTFFSFFVSPHTRSIFFFYLYFFGYVCSALHRDFKRVYVTVFCVYSPLCRCFLQASTLCLFLLLMLLLLFLTSFFRDSKKTRTRLVGARERRNWVRKREVGREDRWREIAVCAQKRNELETTTTTTTHKKR